MSKATKRKHVTREVLEDYILPDENQQILKIVGGRGNNLHEAQTSGGERFLISMPTRFRKNVWIKRGDYVLADPITEGDKVKGEIVAILYPKQVKYIKEEKLWPEGFDGDNRIEELTRNLQDAAISDEVSSTESHNHQDNISNSKDHNAANNGVHNGNDTESHNHLDDDSEDDYSSEDNDDDLFVNTNRPTVTYFYSDSSGEEEEEEEEGSEEEEKEEKEEAGYEHGSDSSADR